MKENKVMNWVKKHKKGCYIAGGICACAVSGAACYLAYKGGFDAGINKTLGEALEKATTDNVRNGITDRKFPNVTGTLYSAAGELLAKDEIWAEPHEVCAIAEGLKLENVHEVTEKITEIMRDEYPQYDYNNGNVIIEFMKK